MILHVTDAHWVDGYRFEISLSDGHRGIVDLEPALYGPVFGALRTPTQFAQGRLDPEAHTLVWPNGADLAPEYLLYLLARDEPGLQAQFKRWGYLEERTAAQQGAG